MGRELRRVALDFDWPMNRVWEGFVNPLHTAIKCKDCEGGYSPTAERLKNQWYGNAPFRPEDRGSIPFKPTDAPVVAFATRNVESSPGFYGRDAIAIEREAQRLCAHWNRGWSHHLNDGDVAALLKAKRLYDFTHTFDLENRWQPKDPPCVPSAREVNIWSISGGMGHDSINSWVCVKAECKRLGVSEACATCDGNGEIWPSAEAEAAYEAWQATPPPRGDGYQIWETVSEGSPISPVFATPEELARHMAGTKWGADHGTPYGTWLKFIQGPGWAPSGVMQNGVFENGVAASVR